MKNKKGFTLIELLAIIVILAIIAVITVPIILNIIDNAKMGTAMDSTYGYKDAVQKLYVTKLSSDSTYNIPDGNYSTEQLKSMGLSISGKEPESNSWITIIKNNVSAGCLQYDEYKVDIKNGRVENAEKGECDKLVVFNGTYVAPQVGDTHKGIVYLNPSDLSTECSSTFGYTEAQSVPGVKTGCMKFYIFNENTDGTLDMILDHNTSTGIQWTMQMYGSLDASTHSGPREALYQLYEDTKNWIGLSDLTESNNYTPSTTNNGWTYIIDYTKNLKEPNSFEYTSDAKPYKARFISAEEIAHIVGKDDWNLKGSEFYLDDSLKTAANPSQYSWLYENLNNCEKYGCKKQSSSELSGNQVYWTGSYYAADVGSTWCVWNSGNLGTNNALQTNVGIRPVISLPGFLITK